MSDGEKAIFGGLKKAKVSKDLVHRTRKLIECAIAYEDESSREIEAVARYLCGVAGELPPLSEDFREHRGDAVWEGLSEGRTPDAWDLRAVDVIAQGKDASYWLEAWTRRRLQRYPGEPIFDEAVALLRSRGLWRTDEDVVHSLLAGALTYATEEGVFHSAARWMLERIDRDAEAVLAAARSWRSAKQKRIDRTPTLYALLAAHRREVFDRLCQGAPPADEGDRARLAATMLKTDPGKYEGAALQLLSGLEAPIPAAQAALILEHHLPGKHREVLRSLLFTAIRADRKSFWDDQHEQHDTYAVVVDLAWPALGEGAFELWKEYREENDAIRLDFYEVIENQAGEKALPWLVEGLLYPKDPKVEYGYLTHAKYVARIAKLLRKYDLAPYRERIEKAFAGAEDRRIRQEIDALLGKRPAAAPARKAAFDPMKGYGFDRYAAALVKNALAAVKKRARKLPSPIGEVKLTGRDDGDIALSCILLEGGGEEAAIEFALPRAEIPSHIDLCEEEDRVLPRFAKLHGLERGGDLPAWGDDYQLPSCVLTHEHIAAARAIAAGMREMGLELGEDCRVGVGGHDSFEDELEHYAALAREGVLGLPEDQQADFAALCFVDPGKQAWLLGR